MSRLMNTDPLESCKPWNQVSKSDLVTENEFEENVVKKAQA